MDAYSLLTWINMNMVPIAEEESCKDIEACYQKEIEDIFYTSLSVLVIRFTDQTALVITAGQKDTDDIHESHEPNYKTCRATLSSTGGN